MAQPAGNTPVGRAVVSVSEMAGMLGLSRGRFHELCKREVFPMPVYDLRSRRPFYDTTLQQLCMQIRRSGIGWNGQYILFYRTGQQSRGSSPRSLLRKGKKSNGEGIPELVDALRHLGLSVTGEKVEKAVAKLYPGGLPSVEGDVIRALFVYLRRGNPA